MSKHEHKRTLVRKREKHGSLSQLCVLPHERFFWLGKSLQCKSSDSFERFLVLYTEMVLRVVLE